MNDRRRPGLTAPTVFLALAGVILSLLLPATASATPLSSKRAQLRELQAKLEKVYRKADIAVERYNQAREKLETVKRQIAENRRLLRLAEYNLQVANQQLAARAESIYKTDDVSFVDVIFAARSFDELVTQLDMMTRLGNSDVDTVKSIAAYRQEIRDRRVKLEADREAAAKLVAEAAARKDEILAIEARLERMTRGLRADIRRLEAQQAAAAAAAAQRAQQQAPVDVPDPGGPGHPEVVAIAQRYLGVPYVYGGASPSGFDCSGLTMYCYAQIGISLPHGATAQQQMSTPVPISALQPGDLVFFGGPSYSYHVGIYVGGGTMIHAPHTGAVVSYGSISGAWIGGRF